MIRLDKYLANANFGSRKEVKQAIRKGLVLVNNEVCLDDDLKIDPKQDIVHYDEMLVNYDLVVYIMLNKPDGYVSATSDHLHPTVIELIDEIVPSNIFPVGRLDIDTEGLLLITNDGHFSHNLMSPKHHVPKTYYVEIEHPLSASDISALEAGIMIDNDEQCKGAEVEVLSDNAINLTIYEGKYHQVKRMLKAVNNEVLFLKRVKIADLHLDDTLAVGEWRYLTEADFTALNIKK